MRTSDQIKAEFKLRHKPIKGKVEDQDFIDVISELSDAMGIVIDRKLAHQQDIEFMPIMTM